MSQIVHDVPCFTQQLYCILSENCGVMPRDMQSERTNNSEAADKNKDKGSESKEK